MQVAIATGLYPPETGGPATYSKLLHDKLGDFGMHAWVVPFSKVRKLPPIVRHIVYFVLLVVRSRKTSCIYAQDPVSVGLPAYLAAKVMRKKFVLKVVGDYAWEQGVQRFKVTELLDDFLEKDSYPLPVRIMRSIERFVATRADAVIVPSRYLEGVVRAWGVESKNIHVIYNSFDAPRDPGKKVALRRLLGFEGKILLTAGRLVPWKGFEEIIELAPELTKKITDLRIVIAGEGPYRSVLEKKIQELSLENQVVLTGALSRDVLHGYIAATDVFVLYSGYEGLSHMLLEVMAVGTPIVASNVGGNPELIEDGSSGWLVPYGNKEALSSALFAALSHPRVAGERAKRAGEKLAVFSERAMLEKTAELLKEVCT